MSKHLKTTIFSLLTSTLFQEVPSPAVSKVHARGVRYLYPIDGINYYCGMMNSHKQGQKYRKHIIVRRVPRFGGLHQLYTYHFPKTWSAACIANRELIKTAQKLAHDLEHDYSPEGIEWRLRFFHHYFHVVKGGAKPEPGLKPYTRFYQYVYVSIYRDLKSAAQQASVQEVSLAEQPTTSEPSLLSAPCVSAESPSPLSPEDVSFVPIDPRPLRFRRTYPLNALSLSSPLGFPIKVTEKARVFADF
ncbi:MAG: hypothetical protein IKP57_03155 [Paludibacteraceae bacterium]|nr:hypothetical protein [Paludibacteraceae bacterium]